MLASLGSVDGLTAEERDAIYETVWAIEEKHAAELDAAEHRLVADLEGVPQAREHIHQYDMARIAVGYEIMCAAYALGRRHAAGG